MHRRPLLAGLASAALMALVAYPLMSMAQPAMSTAEVTKIDKNGIRVTLKHGEIKNLDMPPMTMVFRVREPKWLDSLAVGDRVRFAADRVDGSYTVTALEKMP